MRDRVRQKIHQRLLSAEDQQADYWLNLLRELDSARVSTIHSFCASLLRAHAVEAGLDPRFGVLEQTESETLLAELVDDLLRQCLARHDEPTLALASVFGLGQLKSMLQRLAERSDEADLDRWQDTTPAELVQQWATFHSQVVVPLTLEEIERSDVAQRVPRILSDCELTGQTMPGRRATLLELLPNLATSQRPADDVAALIDAARVQGAKKAFADAEQYEQFRDAAAELRKKLKAARDKHLAFDSQAALPAAEAGLDLLSLARDLNAQFDAAKQELSVLDFNDLIRRASRLLTDPANQALRRRIAARIQLVMVDEFQDTSPAQVALVRALCGDRLQSGKLFFVGDRKQSIYRFRGAKPEVVLNLREEIPEPGRLPLTCNFRSQPALIDFVNAVFSEPFGDDYEPLVAHRRQTTAQPSVELLWAPADEEDQAAGARQRSRQREADWIARRLRGMFDSGERLVVDEDASSDTPDPQARPVRQGDIAILFRALSDVQLYEEALRRYGIDYYLVGGHAFYAQQEIFDLTNLLRAVANPADHVALIGMLRSPFFSLADETLFWLGRHAEGLDAGLMAAEYPDAVEPADRQLARAAAETLRELRSLKDRMSVADLIQLALDRTGYDAVLLAEFLGERKLANLRKLIDQARVFDQSGLFGLDDFLVQLSQFVANQPHEPLAATQPEATDVVRLMTIHQAKGLEFPVVVLADLERRGHEQPGSVALCDRLGPLVRWQDRDGDRAVTGFDLHNYVERLNEQQESVRLFYVACTRAADYLILSSGVDLEKWPEGAWTRLLARRFDLEQGAVRGQLPPGCGAPGVRVTMSRPEAKQDGGRTARLRLEESLAEAERLASEERISIPPTVLPAPVDSAARRQFSFSRLTGELKSKPPRPAAPNESAGADAQALDPIDPLGLGTLVHAALERALFTKRGAAPSRSESPADSPSRPPTQSRHDETASPLASPLENDVPGLVARLAPRHDLSEGPETRLAIELIERFLGSPQAAELAAARVVHREVEFLLGWPPESFTPGGRYLQGFIDCLYQGEDGLWRILDYKTNRIPDGDLVAAAAPYEMQMLLYALAAERVLGHPPAELILYFLRPGQAFRYAWDASARGRVVDQITHAIERLTQSYDTPAAVLEDSF